MKRRYKILSWVAIISAVGILALRLALSHNAECTPSPTPPAGAQLMKAIVYRCYGGPEVLKLEDVARPTLADDEVLVNVRAASVNPLDWHYMRGEPYLMRLMGAGMGAPKEASMGVDYAGTVEAVGKSVTRFKPGDEVFGGRSGALADYVKVRESRGIALKPANVTYEQAAGVTVAGLTALQALRDKGHIQAGDQVLINGASGGVGTFAVQLAKSFGAEVTAVCSTRNVELVRSLGADHVIDYKQQDFTKGAQRYDLIVDMVVNRPLSDYKRVLEPDGTFVIVGGTNEGKFLGPMVLPMKALLINPFVSQEFAFFISQTSQKDLELLADLMAAGKVTTVIDRTYPLSEVPAAIAYLEEGHARGKVIIAVEQPVQPAPAAGTAGAADSGAFQRPSQSSIS